MHLKSNPLTRLPFPAGAGLLAALAVAPFYLSACNQTQPISAEGPPMLYVGELPPCVLHPEMVPDPNSDKVQKMHVEEHDCYYDIDHLQSEGKFAEAMAACQKLLADQEAQLGKDNCDMLPTLRRMAQLQEGGLHDPQACLSTMKRIIELRVKYLGVDCLDTAAAVQGAILPMCSAGHARQIVDMVQHYRGMALEHHPSISCQIGYLYALALAQQTQGQYAPACASAQAALNLKAQVPPLNMVWPKPYALLLVAAQCARQKGHLDQAYEYLSQADHLRFGKHQMEDGRYIDELLLLAHTWKTSGNQAGVDKSLRMAVELASTDPGLPRSYLQQSWQALRSHLMETGKAAEAARLDASMLALMTPQGSNR